jgi:hypothetical protein
MLDQDKVLKALKKLKAADPKMHVGIDIADEHFTATVPELLGLSFMIYIAAISHSI